MDWLNYHHLHYFWQVAREGSITRASAILHLSHPTISKQLRQLEASLKRKLFKRAGRNLVLTEFGQMVFRYAEAIFLMGQELQDAVRSGVESHSLQLSVGMPDVLPKLIAHRLLRPALKTQPSLRLVCHEGTYESLLADLAVHRLDLVLADVPAGPTVNVRAFNHLLGECGVTFFGAPKLADQFRPSFPNSLGAAPLLLPTERSAIRRELEQWLYQQSFRPRIVGEFEDSALMKVFGQDGWGLFPAPSVIETDVCQQYGVQVVGRVKQIRERFYAISVERRLKHPAVVSLCKSARNELFD